MQNQENNQPKKRTKKQNSAFHLWCKELSDEANVCGINQRVILEQIEVDWTEDAVKGLVRAIAKAKYGITKTSELTTIQLTDCCEEVNKIFASKGIHVPFPSLENAELLKFYENF